MLIHSLPSHYSILTVPSFNSRMAMQVQEGGFDAMFMEEIREEYKCVFCWLVIRDPVQIMSCGHRFCARCFDEYKKKNTEEQHNQLLCPVDREVVSPKDVLPDRGFGRSICNLSVKCGNAGLGCGWINDLRDLHDHEQSCAYRVIPEVEQLSVNDSGDGTLLQQILSRVEKCEQENASLKDEMRIKDDEISALKLANSELQHEVESANIANTFDFVKKELFEVICDVKDIKNVTIRNIENVLFTQRSPPQESIVFEWVMEDYKNLQRIGEPVYSPIFHKCIDGYRCQLKIEWSGKKKRKISFYLKLSKFEDFEGDIEPFHREYTLELKKKNGGWESFTVNFKHLKDNEDIFQLDEDDEAGGYGADMDAPANQFVINNSLFASCTIHFE